MKTNLKTTLPPPKTALEFLDRQEARTVELLATSVQQLGEDLCASTQIRERVRRHPFAAVGLGAIAGSALVPLLSRSLPRLLGTAALLRGLASKNNALLSRVAAQALRSLNSAHGRHR